MTPDGASCGMPRLVLASASPRRRQILEALGVRATWVDVDIDEQLLPGESPEAMVARLAAAKAAAGLAAQGSGAGSQGVVVIGADTTVALDGEIFGKPADDGEARAMLARLSGRVHETLSGVAVATAGGSGVAVDRTRVRMRAMSAREIECYVASGEPRGKAGAYAIQGRAGLFVEGIEGSYHTVVGLPVLVLDQLCTQVAGHGLLAWAAEGTGE